MRLTFGSPRALASRFAGLAVGAGLLCAHAVAAQSALPSKMDPDKVLPFSTFYALVGRLNADPTMVNSHFTRPDLANGTGFSALSNDAYSVGIGGSTPIAGMIAGFEWTYADFGYETSPQGKTNRAETTYFMLTGGLPFYTTWKMTLFPFLGVGAGSMRVTLKTRDGGPSVSTTKSPTFDEIVLSPGLESQILGTYLMVQPGLGLDYLLLSDDPKSHLGVTLGVRFGTAITPNRTPWKYRGTEVFGGPTFQPSGGTLRVLVGIGGFRIAGAK